VEWKKRIFHSPSRQGAQELPVLEALIHFIVSYELLETPGSISRRFCLALHLFLLLLYNNSVKIQNGRITQVKISLE